MFVVAVACGANKRVMLQIDIGPRRRGEDYLFDWWFGSRMIYRLAEVRGSRTSGERTCSGARSATYEVETISRWVLLESIPTRREVMNIVQLLFWMDEK